MQHRVGASGSQAARHTRSLNPPQGPSRPHRQKSTPVTFSNTSPKESQMLKRQPDPCPKHPQKQTGRDRYEKRERDGSAPPPAKTDPAEVRPAKLRNRTGMAVRRKVRSDAGRTRHMPGRRRPKEHGRGPPRGRRRRHQFPDMSGVRLRRDIMPLRLLGGDKRGLDPSPHLGCQWSEHSNRQQLGTALDEGVESKGRSALPPRCTVVRPEGHSPRSRGDKPARLYRAKRHLRRCPAAPGIHLQLRNSKASHKGFPHTRRSTGEN